MPHLFSPQVLYTGLLVDLSRTRTHPPAALAALTGKDLSFFYWGCNVLYWGELSGQTASTTSTGEVSRRREALACGLWFVIRDS